MPVIPTPAPSPVAVESKVVGGGTASFTVSGGAQTAASGEVGALSGPYAVETQSMSITYSRMPRAYESDIMPNISLSSISYGQAIGKTFLLARVECLYSKVKDYSTYETSSFQQSQKFEVYAASADSSGQSYGEINASCLGPAGNIITAQPYYRRTYWDDNTDTEVTRQMVGYNFVPVKRDDVPGALVFSGVSWQGSEEYMGDFPKSTIVGQVYSTIRNQAGNYASESYITTQPLGDDYSLNGGYSTEQESLSQMIAFINTMGDRCKNSDHYNDPPTVTFTSWGAQSPVLDQGFAEYDKNRHDFT
jgi:hypothetical protein